MSDHLNMNQLFVILRTKVNEFPTKKEAAEWFGCSEAYMGDLYYNRRSISRTIAERLGFIKKTIFILKD